MRDHDSQALRLCGPVYLPGALEIVSSKQKRAGDALIVQVSMRGHTHRSHSCLDLKEQRGKKKTKEITKYENMSTEKTKI